MNRVTTGVSVNSEAIGKLESQGTARPGRNQPGRAANRDCGGFLEGTRLLRVGTRVDLPIAGSVAVVDRETAIVGSRARHEPASRVGAARTRRARRRGALVRLGRGWARRIAREVAPLAVAVRNAGRVVLEVTGIVGHQLATNRATGATASLPPARCAVALQVRGAGSRTGRVAGEVQPLAVAVRDAARMVDEVVGVGAHFLPTDRAAGTTAPLPLPWRAVALLRGRCPRQNPGEEQHED